MDEATCSVDECPSPSRCRGWCRKHYAQQQRAGNVLPRTIAEVVPGELWLPISEFHGAYEVSDHGRVQSLDRTIHYGNGHTRRQPGRLLAPSRANNGYRMVTLRLDGVLAYRLVHRIVLETFVGACPEGMEACHGLGGSLDNRLINLRWDTLSENARDTIRHGNHHMTKRLRCPQRHLLEEPNIVASYRRRGQRKCLACNRAQANGARAEQHGRAFDFKAVADRHYEEIMAA